MSRISKLALLFLSVLDIIMWLILSTIRVSPLILTIALVEIKGKMSNLLTKQYIWPTNIHVLIHNTDSNCNNCVAMTPETFHIIHVSLCCNDYWFYLIDWSWCYLIKFNKKDIFYIKKHFYIYFSWFFICQRSEKENDDEYWF